MRQIVTGAWWGRGLPKAETAELRDCPKPKLPRAEVAKQPKAETAESRKLPRGDERQALAAVIVGVWQSRSSAVFGVRQSRSFGVRQFRSPAVSASGRYRVAR